LPLLSHGIGLSLKFYIVCINATVRALLEKYKRAALWVDEFKKIRANCSDFFVVMICFSIMQRQITRRIQQPAHR
jgi:hypothetical protein